MPTPPLPVLHALLTSLSIPVLPPALNCIPPTLLLLVLESLLCRRLPLNPHLRSPSTPDDELELTKCVLGVLADDVLALDLAVVDPARVCAGAEMDVSVVVMALAVVARRRGVDVRLPTPVESDEDNEGYRVRVRSGARRARDRSMLDDDEAKGVRTVPLTPSSAEDRARRHMVATAKDSALDSVDVSQARHSGTWSSSTAGETNGGVGSEPDGKPIAPPPPTPSCMVTPPQSRPRRDLDHLDPLSPTNSTLSPSPSPSPSHSHDPTPARELPSPTPSTPQNQVRSGAARTPPSTSRRRTVLQQLIDEFGLEAT